MVAMVVIVAMVAMVAIIERSGSQTGNRPVCSVPMPIAYFVRPLGQFKTISIQHRTEKMCNTQ